MKWLYNVKISVKIAGFVMFVALILGTVGYMGYSYLAAANHDIFVLYQERLLPVQWLNENATYSRAIQTNLFEIMVTTDVPRKKRIIAGH